jgi:hypothetical protein
MPTRATGPPPGIQCRSPEEKLAATTVLLSGDRACRCKSPQCVAMHAQILRRLARVEPVIAQTLLNTEPGNNRGCQAISEAIE